MTFFIFFSLSFSFSFFLRSFVMSSVQYVLDDFSIKNNLSSFFLPFFCSSFLILLSQTRLPSVFPSVFLLSGHLSIQTRVIGLCLFVANGKGYD